MKPDRTLWKLVLVAVAVALISAAAQASPRGRCSLAGAWTGDNDAGLVFLITINPLDPSHTRFSSLADSSMNDPTGFGIFPTAVAATDFQGELVRTGRRTFEQTALAYVRDEVSWIGTFAVAATWTLSPDCEVAEVVWLASAFFAGEDPFEDDPFLCLPPITGTYRRVPVVPSSCEP